MPLSVPELAMLSCVRLCAMNPQCEQNELAVSHRASKREMTRTSNRAHCGLPTAWAKRRRLSACLTREGRRFRLMRTIWPTHNKCLCCARLFRRMGDLAEATFCDCSPSQPTTDDSTDFVSVCSTETMTGRNGVTKSARGSCFDDHPRRECWGPL